MIWTKSIYRYFTANKQLVARFTAGITGIGFAGFSYRQFQLHSSSSDSIVYCDSAPSSQPSHQSSTTFDEWSKNRVGEYENKLRTFSHPWKVFNYFASHQKGDEKFMTVYDFIRSIIPYRSYYNQSGEGNALHQRVPSAEEFFALADMDGDGLISFSEYFIFITLLGTSMTKWKVSFKIFDDNGDGTLSKDEFEKIIRYHVNSVRSGGRMGSVEKEHQIKIQSSGLLAMFFGRNGKKLLTYEEFADFMERLQLEVLNLEFHQFPVKNKTISLQDFGKSILAFGPQNHLHTHLERLNDFHPKTDERVSFEQFVQFDRVSRTKLRDIGLAYQFYPSMATRSWGKVEFREIMKRVGGLTLSDGQVDLIFHMFDKNHDGCLDEDEFYTWIKGRNSKGLSDQNPEFSLAKIIKCIST